MSETKDASSTRRDFLRAVGATTASFSVSGLKQPVLAEELTQKTARHPLKHEHESSPADSAAIQYPRIFTGRQLARISFPLGGIGTGGIGLGGRGNLMDWEIFNRPDVGNSPNYAFPAIWAKLGNRAPESRVLERRFLPPYDLKPDNLGSANVPGLPRFAEAIFRGSFPAANIEFRDEMLPVMVSLDAASSFQPLDVDTSGLPFAILKYTARNPDRESAEVVIAWTLENPLGAGKQRQNEIRSVEGMRGVLMTDASLTQDDPLRGSVVLAAIEEKSAQISVRPHLQDNDWNMGVQRFWFNAFSKTGDLGEEVEPHSAIASASIRQTIPPGESRTYRFLISWHLPNRTPARCGWDAPKGEENALLGNYYCTRFEDAWAVAQHVQKNLAEIESGTRAFVQALQSSTLPAVVIEAATANLPTLVSNTSFRTADGSFHGFEGCGDGKGWGFGTCTHVWNYEVATQFLFPSLARSIRSTSFGYATDKEGHMDFRHKLPLGKEHWGAAATDGQMGQIVKLYLDWKLNGDDEWLRQLWPACKRALAYAWRPGGWDGDKDGVMEGAQHNTYDIEFYGPNPLCESWYLAALRACTEMAASMNDLDFAHECKNLFQQGSRWTDTHLFNGEYYFQQVRGIPEKEIAQGLRLGAGAKDTLHPDFQAGAGCLIDQLLGQYMADIAGLGPLLDEAHIHTTLASIYKYNYRTGMNDAPSVERAFSVNGESALVMCDYGKSERPEIPFPYYSENFTGSEYAVAILMLRYGMVKEGVECIANIRARYDGEKANPYNEAEYGRHYARAMASWGSIPILSGFLYNGITRELEIKPLLHQPDFRCFWSIPTAWGSFQVERENGRSTLRLEPSRGAIEIKQLKLRAEGLSNSSAKMTLGGHPISCSVETHGGDIFLTAAEFLRVTPAAPLIVSVLPVRSIKS
jgi:non-lysosomal glucosylceramidase